jgi:hypothetical protein
MKPFADSASFSRPLDRSPYGKRICRIEFSIAEPIEILAQEKAKSQGLTIQRYMESVLIVAVGGTHGVIVHDVPRASKDKK